jgi:signal transduction histidine kinase
MKGLSAQITLFVVVAVAVTALMVGGVVYTGLTRLMEKEAVASLGQTTQLAETRLQATFETLRQDLRVFAGLPPIQGLLTARNNAPFDGCEAVALWQRRLVYLFADMLRYKPQYREVRFYAADGHELVGVEQIDGEIVASLPARACQAVTVSRNDPGAAHPDAQAVHLSRADADDGIEASVVRAAIFVHDPEGRQWGRVILDLRLQQALAAQQDRADGNSPLRFYVTDEHGHFLLGPEGESQPTTIDRLYPELAPLFDGRDSAREAFVRHADDADTALHFRKVPLGQNSSIQFLGLAFAGSFQALTSGSRSVARDSAVLIMVLALMAGGGAVFLVQFVLHPVRKLTRAAHAVADQQGPVDLPLTTQNEIGVLARAFQAMLDRLRQRETALADRAAQLDRINGELHELIYVMAHDLRAPLRAVSGLASIIEEDLGSRLDPGSAQNMEALRARVRRMDEFIDALLAFSRAGLRVGPAEPVQLRTLLRDVILMLGIPPEVEIELPEDLPRLTADRVRLTQVFANLIGNAVKHGAKRHGRVRIGVQEVAGGFYEFSVQDNGPGIAPEHHGKIFGMFQTLNAQSTGECAGVGLAIVKKIVESVGGRVRVESELGHGCAFFFTWPVAMGDAVHGVKEMNEGLAAPLS